jgi:hypothetical protein
MSKVMSIDTTTKAYMDGYMTALFRKGRDKNPYTKEIANYVFWDNGYTRGSSTVEFHTTAIRTRASAHWLLNE